MCHTVLLLIKPISVGTTTCLQGEDGSAEGLLALSSLLVLALAAVRGLPEQLHALLQLHAPLQHLQAVQVAAHPVLGEHKGFNIRGGQRGQDLSTCPHVRFIRTCVCKF